MAQKKEKKDIKVHDLKPRKDAQGGAGRVYPPPCGPALPPPCGPGN
jgi:hypothetical protein